MAFKKLNDKLNSTNLKLVEIKNEVEINKNFDDICLKVFYLNIRSFNKNNLELRLYLQTFCFKFDVIILVEIWENFQFSTEKDIHGYKFNMIVNSNNKNAGVLLYSKIELESKQLDTKGIYDPQEDKHIDIIGIELKILNQIWSI